MLHLNPHHPLNTTSGSTTRKGRAGRTGQDTAGEEVTTSPTHDTSHHATSPRQVVPNPPQTPMETQSPSPSPQVRREREREKEAHTPSPRRKVKSPAISNRVEFRTIAEMGSDDEAELEAENELLKWKVMQLTTTGEQYRQKVEVMYMQSKARHADLNSEIDLLRETKSSADESANQAAAELAIVNTVRSKLENNCSELNQSLIQIKTRLSETLQKLKTKRVDTALAEVCEGDIFSLPFCQFAISKKKILQNDQERLSTSLVASKARVEDLGAQLRALRAENEDISVWRGSFFLFLSTFFSYTNKTFQVRISDVEAQRDGDLATIKVQEADLRQWNQETTDASSEVRKLVSRLDAAVADCIQLAETAAALAPHLAESEEVHERAKMRLSPLKVKDTSVELKELREVNRRVCHEKRHCGEGTIPISPYSYSTTAKESKTKQSQSFLQQNAANESGPPSARSGRSGNTAEKRIGGTTFEPSCLRHLNRPNHNPNHNHSPKRASSQLFFVSNIVRVKEKRGGFFEVIWLCKSHVRVSCCLS